ncbi:hypothetical protein A1353_15120 [Methylomonas methanica]|uniref:Uncharacterized protein n=1 Tax=Methylomonas methanica TaxID=421 RepID=A0A177MBR4_METMH|nr:hypothetical protein A1353_15120 [Methylomonas methanica]
MHKQLRHAPRGLANVADDALLKAFKPAHAVFCYRRNLFCLARNAFCNRRKAFYLARKPTKPGD